MPRKLDPTPIYYVYILFDWLGIPRYVGKGSGDRWLDHERYTDIENSEKNEFIENTWIILEEIPKIKITENVPEKLAFQTERALIKAIGRADLNMGPLVNHSNGGQGTSGRLSKGKTKGYIWITNGVVQRVVPPDTRLSYGWRRGHLMVPDERFYKSNVGKIWITDGRESKRVWPAEPIPDGWRTGHPHHRDGNRSEQLGRYKNPERRSEIAIARDLGHLATKDQRRAFGRLGADALTAEQRQFINEQMHKATRGSVWITDGIKNKRIKPPSAPPKGWWYGRAGWQSPKNPAEPSPPSTSAATPDRHPEQLLLLLDVPAAPERDD